jgi:hypothetical protein
MSEDSNCPWIGPPLAHFVPHREPRPSDSPVLPHPAPVEAIAAGAPAPDSAPAALKALARVARGALAGFQERLHGVRRARCIARHKRAVARDPENTTLLTIIAHLYEAGGQRKAAGEWYHHLASVYRAKGNTDGVGFCYRKLHHLQQPEPARFYRDLTSLYTQSGHYDRAGRTSRRVVDIYVSEGHRSAAIGYLRGLPESGSLRGHASSELRRLLKGPAASPSETAAHEGVIARGAILDVARLAESRATTGRLELESEGASGLIHFSSGRIVAAQLNSHIASAEALRAILTLESGRYKLVSGACPDVDEFEGLSNAELLASHGREIGGGAGDRDVKFVFSY